MNLPYNFDEDIRTIRQLVDSGDNLRDSMLDMPEREFNRLRWSLKGINRFMRDLEGVAKSVYTERHNNYEKMIRHAQKRFNAVDMAVIRSLDADGEYAIYFKGVVSRVRETLEEPATEEAVRKSIRLLKRRGLVEVANGLFDDDGFTAGSGYQLVYHKREVIEQIISNYHGEPQSHD